MIDAHGSRINDFIARLENDSLTLTEWLPNNLVKRNEDKCHLMVFGAKGNEVSIKMDGTCLKGSAEEHLLGIKFSLPLSFKQDVKALCKKASRSFMVKSEYPVTWVQKNCSK